MVIKITLMKKNSQKYCYYNILIKKMSRTFVVLFILKKYIKFSRLKKEVELYW